MKAYRLHAVNDLRYEDIDIPQLPDDSWCILKVHAAGICSSDIPRVFTKGTYHFPTIPGHEFSGEVYAVGNDKYQSLIGKRCGIFPLIPCRHCDQCKKKNYEMCAHYDYGTFVPNFGLGVDYIRGLRELTDILLDLHLMIKDPEYKLRWIGIKPTDIVSVHYESTFQVQRLLDWLKPYGCKRFIAINPATPVSNIEEVLDYIDGINLLMVNPGFAGQHIVPSTIRKAKKLVDLLKREHHEELAIEVDGNITPEHAKSLREIGANIFVGGTSSIFKGKVEKYSENIGILRDNIK